MTAILFNPWETDTSAPDYVQRITSLPDDAVIYVQLPDPNATEQGLVRVMTGLNLKKVLRNIPVVPKSADYTATLAENGAIIEMSTITGNRTLNLPAVGIHDNGFFLFIRKRSEANTLTIDPDGSYTIDGQTTYTMNHDKEIIMAVWDGATWDVLLKPGDGAFKTWFGSRRETYSNLSITPVSGIASVLTVTHTPQAIGNSIVCETNINSAPNSAAPNNRRTANFWRRKIGTAAYTGMNGSGVKTYMGGGFDQSNYQDWSTSETSDKIRFKTTSLDEIKINLFVEHWSGGSRVNDVVFINRAVNQSYAKDACTWLEILEYGPYGGVEPVAVTTVTAADAA